MYNVVILSSQFDCLSDENVDSVGEQYDGERLGYCRVITWS